MSFLEGSYKDRDARINRTRKSVQSSRAQLLERHLPDQVRTGATEAPCHRGTLQFVLKTGPSQPQVDVFEPGREWVSAVL